VNDEPSKSTCGASTAHIITGEPDRGRRLRAIVSQAQSYGQIQGPVHIEDWIATSPPVEIIFDARDRRDAQ
jgi:hypothetical protein